MIKQGDIVRSNGRIATQQDGRRRWAEFEAALVLETEGADISVSPVGKKAVLICQQGDLHIARAAQEQEPAPAPASDPPKPKPKAKPSPSLRRIKQATDKPTTTKKPSAKKPPANRRRPS